MRLRTICGFTLVELMITLAVIAILALIAVPAYQGYIEKGRRSDAMNALLDLQNRQAQWRTNNVTYATLAQLTSNTTSPYGYYDLAITDVSAAGYTATAAPTGVQAGDDCGTFAVNRDGPDTSGDYADNTCWKR